MKFKHLQQNLRDELWKRIEAKELTGLRVAEQTGFKQAHISNFLNRKRQMSIDGLDSVLSTQHISVLDLLDPKEINKRASILPPSEDEFENVLVVEGQIAAGEPLVTNEDVKEILKFKKSFLERLREDTVTARNDWRRFVMVKVDEREGMSMFPRLLPGATVLIDRHYTSLEPYHKNDKNMYAVRKDGGCTVKYVDRDGRNLVLRPHNHEYSTSVIEIEEGKSLADYIVGRVCHVAIET